MKKSTVITGSPHVKGMKHFILTLLICLVSLTGLAQDDKPQLEYICELRVTCDPAYTVGETAHGERVVIPITGGTFEGPRLKGTVLSGGADYQLVDKDKGRTELEAIYCIRTDDGVTIHVRNAGLMVNEKGDWYFRTAPKFEAPSDSPYDWLNNAIFVCVPQAQKDCISLKVWMVR